MHRHVLVAAFAATFLVACPAPKPPDGINEVKVGANHSSFTLPLDATLSPDGKMAYFVAVADLANGIPGLFSSEVGSSAAPTLMASDDPLVSPLALDITSDGATLYIADASSGNPDSEQDYGRLLTISASGGSLTSLDSTAGYRPRGLVIAPQGVDTVYFTGNDPADGQPGLFKLIVGSSSVNVVAKGSPFEDPSGVAVANNGDIYVTDTASASKTAQVIKIPNGGAPEVFMSELRLGYPAGIALTMDQGTLMVSALDPETGNDLVILNNLKTGELTHFTDGISEFEESAGLHRAKNVNSFVWADSLANNGGTVYVLNPVQ